MKQCYNLPADKVPTGTPLNKKHICHREKNAGKTGMQPWGGWPLPTPEHQHAPIHAGGMFVSLAGCCCQKTLWKYPQIHSSPTQAHTPSSQDFKWDYPDDPRDIPRFDWFLDLLPVTSPDALLASQCTPVLGALSKRPGRGCDPASCRNPPFSRCSL